jgi:hypothetical protein
MEFVLFADAGCAGEKRVRDAWDVADVDKEGWEAGGARAVTAQSSPEQKRRRGEKGRGGRRVRFAADSKRHDGILKVCGGRG